MHKMPVITMMMVNESGEEYVMLLFIHSSKLWISKVRNQTFFQGARCRVQGARYRVQGVFIPDLA